MSFKKIFLLILIISSQASKGQDYIQSLDSILGQNIDYKTKKGQIEKFMDDADISQIPEIPYKLSIYFYRQEIYKEAIKYGKQTKLLRSKENPIDSLLFRKSLSNLVLFLYKDQNFIEAEKYCKQLLRHKRIDKYTGRAHYRLGTIYEDQGDYYKALEFYSRALTNYKEIGTPNDVINTTFNIARVHTSLGDKKNINTASKLLEEFQASNKELLTPKNLQDLFLLLGNIYNHDYLEDKEKSLENYFKALEIAKKRNDKYYTISLHNNIGNIYLKHDLEKARSYLINGIKNSTNSRAKGMFLHNLGIYYFKTKDYDKAIAHIKKSIFSYIDLEKVTDLSTIPIEELESSRNKNYILDALIFLIKYENQRVKTEKDFDKIYTHIKVAEELLEHIRFESDNQQSKLYWQEQASKLYQNAVKTAFLSKKPEKGFYFMEKNKAVLLLEDITDRELKENANLPDNVIIREKLLKNRIYNLQDLYLEKHISNKDSVTDLISNAKIIYYNFIDSLKVDYPKYYNYKNPSEVIALTEVQSLLQKEEIIVEYILNNKNGYGLLIDKNKVDFFELRDVEELNKNISLLKSKIATPFVTQQDFKNYNKLSYTIYKTLFPFKDDKAYLINKKVTIIADHTLQNFPFEALVTDSGFKNDMSSYLISTSEINYAYSFSFLKENQKLQRNHTLNFSGFAPIQFEYDQLSTLKRSRQEIEAAEKQFAGILFINEDATKDSFKTSTEQSKIIHLSTHANATDSISPWIAFKDSKLTLNDLYTTKNNAELVVLSACNSSLGELKPGEGVMSLARGFFYTGANSVIASLWNVDDKSGQYITSSFYKHLKKGKTKSEALRLAKLNYLNDHSLSETSPYYWSSLVLIGDSGAIGVSSLSGYWWALLISIAVLIMLIFWARKKRN